MRLHPMQFHFPETHPFTFIVHCRALSGVSAHIPEAHFIHRFTSYMPVLSSRQCLRQRPVDQLGAFPAS